jgi:uncharacterized protein (TIGR03083 family)
MASLHDTIGLVYSESMRLKEFLSTLPAGDWPRPSACDRWQVADAVGHLTWVGGFYSSVLARALRGDTSPPEDSPGGSANQWGSSDEFFAQTAIRTRQQLGDRLLESFEEEYQRLHRHFSSNGPDDWHKPCYLPAGSRPLHYLPVMAVQELAVHSWDIRSGIQAQAHPSPDTLPVLVERITQRRPPTLDFGSTEAGPARYRFKLTGVVAGEHDLVVEGGEFRFETPGSANTSRTFRCDTATFVLLMYGRLTPESAFSSGLLGPGQG